MVKAIIRELVIDLIGVLGVALLFYGLHLLLPCLAYSVVGCLMIVFAYLASR